MKTVQQVIEEHIPCEVCGNNDVTRFRLRGTVRHGRKSMMVKCDECQEVYAINK